jgi:hypothetical protein
MTSKAHWSSIRETVFKEQRYDMEKWNAELPMLIKDEFIVLGKNS